MVALLNESGRAVEHVRYTAYGSPRRLLTSPIDIAYDDGDLLPSLGSPNAALRNNGCVPLIRPCGSVLVDRRTSQHTDPQSRISGTKAINATHPAESISKDCKKYCDRHHRGIRSWPQKPPEWDC